MAYQLILNNPTPSAVPLEGWVVGYKPLGAAGAYTVAGPFFSMPINIPTADPVGTLYEGYIKRDCGPMDSAEYFWQTPCNCITGYTVSPSGRGCESVETIPATVTNAGFCLAPSTNGAYSNFGMRVYTSAATEDDFNQPWESSRPTYVGKSSLAGLWANPTSSATVGPMNREGVWIDSDCDGTKNSLSSGAQTTIGHMYNNPTNENKTMYIGVASDNRFTVVVNGTDLTGEVGFSDIPFKIWHLIPFTAVPGPNYINIVATGDGSVNDAVAAMIYDNTSAQLLSAASESNLNVVFRTSTLRGTSYDVANCPAGYSLDSSGGSGNNVCVKTLYRTCNSIVYSE